MIQEEQFALVSKSMH